MADKKLRIKKGIILRPDAVALEGIEGEIKVDSGDSKLKATLGAASRELLTGDQAQTVSNKTIDSSNAIAEAALPTSINAAKIADGSVSNTEFQHISTVTSNVQTQLNTNATAISDHLADAIDVHAASAITNTPVGNLVATTVQNALNELQSELDGKALASDLANHLSDVTDAHDASSISNIPAGNLAATDQQAVNNELQSDIDSRALSSDLTTHTGASTGVHGVTGSVVGTSGAQTIADKTLTSPIINTASIVSPSRLDMKKDTKANLTTYAITASDGQLVFATDTTETFVVESGALSAVGGGGGISDLDTLESLDFESTSLASFTHTGLALSIVNPIKGITSALLTSNGGATQFFKKVIAVDRKFRGKNLTLGLQTRSSATQGNITILVYDETNAANLAASQPITLGSTSISATTNTNTILSGLSSSDVNKLKVGQSITGSGIQANTVITAINATALTATISLAATASATVTLKISDLPQKQSFSFDVPNNCSSLSYTVSALVESGSPESYFDDVVIKLSSVLLSSSVITTTKFNATDWTSYTPTLSNLGSTSGVAFKYRQVGQNYEIEGSFTVGTPGGSGTYTISLPSGAVIGHAMPNDSMFGELAFGQVTGTSNNYFVGGSAGDTVLSIYVHGASLGYSKVATSGPLPTSGAIFFIKATVPIAGLTTNTTENQTIELSTTQLVQQPDSAIRFNATNGYGSTNTKIRRFGSPIANIGSDITYLDSATDGASFVINSAGIYDITYGDFFNSSSSLGISLNSTELTTGIDTIASASRISNATSNTQAMAVTTTSLFLNVGDIIRPHTGGVASPTTQSSFSISKAGSLKQLNVSNDSKIIIPTHELRFEGASSRGAVDTAIVKFDTLAKVRGDGFSVVNTANNGTVITILKAGTLAISSSLYNASGADFYISKNQTTLTAIPVISEIMSACYANTASMSSPSTEITVKVGDIIRISGGSTPTSHLVNQFNLSLTETSIPANFSNVLPQWSESDSALHVQVGNGKGSINTAIRRFSNLITSIGSDITYTDSATLGSSFTINSDGLYDIHYSDLMPSGTMGISKNTTQPATEPNSVADGSILRQTSLSVGDYTEVSGQFYLIKGDVIRPHTNTVIDNSAHRNNFTISKVGKPNLTAVDVTPFVNMKLKETQQILITQAGNALTDRSAEIEFNLATASITNSNTNILTIVDDSANTRTKIIASKKCVIDVMFQERSTSGSRSACILKNGSIIAAGNYPSAADPSISTASIILEANDFLTFGVGTYDFTTTDSVDNSSGLVRVVLTAEADVDSVVTPIQQVSSDTILFNFKATAIDSNNDAIGTFNTYTYVASSNTPTISGTAPTQTTDSMRTNGVQVFARAYNATSTTASPCRVDIFLGKGLKNVNLEAYEDLAKASTMFYDVTQDGVTNWYGTFKGYNETTGIFTLNAGISFHNTRYAGFTSAGTLVSSGYFVFNASKTPSLAALPALQQRVAYLKDLKASGTSGGTSTTGAWTTRVLNTLEGDTSIAALSSNQFILQSGIYDIDAFSCFHGSDGSRILIRNVTDSTDDILSLSTRSVNDATLGGCVAALQGRLILTTAKTFELRYRVSTSKATDGLGQASSFGVSEIYSQVKITKVK